MTKVISYTHRLYGTHRNVEFPKNGARVHIHIMNDSNKSCYLLFDSWAASPRRFSVEITQSHFYQSNSNEASVPFSLWIDEASFGTVFVREWQSFSKVTYINPNPRY